MIRQKPQAFASVAPPRQGTLPLILYCVILYSVFFTTLLYSLFRSLYFPNLILHFVFFVTLRKEVGDSREAPSLFTGRAATPGYPPLDLMIYFFILYFVLFVTPFRILYLVFFIGDARVPSPRHCSLLRILLDSRYRS